MKNSIDHIIYSSPELALGMDMIEELLGLRPVLGGKHPKWGTHNALLSLGNSYLEVVAPHPELSKNMDKTWIDSFLAAGPKLSSWVLQTQEIALYREKGIAAGINFGTLQNGQRQKPDGTILTWQLTDPYAMPMNGVLPFLIDWGNTPHPSQNLPIAGNLKELKLFHPESDLAKDQLKSLDVDLVVGESELPKLEAMIQTKNGLVSLL